VRELDRMEKQNQQLREVTATLAGELRKGTIERVLAMSDPNSEFWHSLAKGVRQTLNPPSVQYAAVHFCADGLPTRVGLLPQLTNDEVCGDEAASAGPSG
jgi:hypothetical protein